MASNYTCFVGLRKPQPECRWWPWLLERIRQRLGRELLLRDRICCGIWQLRLPSLPYSSVSRSCAAGTEHNDLVERVHLLLMFTLFMFTHMSMSRPTLYVCRRLWSQKTCGSWACASPHFQKSENYAWSYIVCEAWKSENYAWSYIICEAFPSSLLLARNVFGGT